MTGASPSPRPARRWSPEADEQASLIRWRDLFAPQEPRLKWLHASLNGVKMTKGQASKAKAAGMTAGVWDLFLPVPKRHDLYTVAVISGERMPVTSTGGIPPEFVCCGLYIEMKSARGAITAEQQAFATRSEGYAYRVCRSWIEAATAICDYLGLPADHPAREAAK